MSSKAGVVVTSSRASSRRSSTASAASAFAVATAASSNPPDPGTRAAFELYGVSAINLMKKLSFLVFICLHFSNV